MGIKDKDSEEENDSSKIELEVPLKEESSEVTEEESAIDAAKGDVIDEPVSNEATVDETNSSEDLGEEKTTEIIQEQVLGQTNDNEGTADCVPLPVEIIDKSDVQETIPNEIQQDDSIEGLAENEDSTDNTDEQSH